MTGVIAELDAVTFGYGRKSPVVSGLSARFEEGRICAVSGSSGCGKSTMLSLLGLLLKPAGGEVSILGTRCGRASDMTRSAIRRHHVGFVFQDALLETSMTVWQNLAESLPPSVKTRPMRDRAAEALEEVSLPAALLDRKALTLSGGQAQRVAVVRALLKQPQLVLADEPTGNLDDDSGAMVLEALFSYGHRSGSACVIVTHDTRIVQQADDELRIGE